MTPEAKEKFIRSLCNSVRDSVIERIKYMPEEWDGIELREYLAREFERETVLSRNPQPDRKRLREFKRVAAVTFGL